MRQAEIEERFRKFGRSTPNHPQPQRSTPAFRLITEKGQGIYPGIALDKTSTLLAAEDEQRYGAGT